MATNCFPPLEQPPAVAPSITDPVACKLFREWEANTLAPWLITSAPKICDALNLSNSVIDMTKFKGTHVFGNTYNLGDSVVLNDRFYVSLQDGNVSVPPSSGWQDAYRNGDPTRPLEALDATLPTEVINLGQFESGFDTYGRWIKYPDKSFIYRGFSNTGVGGRTITIPFTATSLLVPSLTVYSSNQATVQLDSVPTTTSFVVRGYNSSATATDINFAFSVVGVEA